MLGLIWQILSRVNEVLARLRALAVGVDEIKHEQVLQRAMLQQLLDSMVLPEAVAFTFDTVLEGITHKGTTNMILTDTQKVLATIKPVDAKGKPAPVEGVPVWASSNPAVVSVTPAVDGMSAIVAANTDLGTAQISVVTKALDLNGDGIAADLTGVLDIEVKAGEAVGLEIVAGTPSEQ